MDEIIKRIVKKTTKFIKKIYHYSKWLNFKDFILCVFFEILIIEKLIQIQIGSESIHVRTTTPDIGVAANCLISEEYSVKSYQPSVIVDAGAYIGISSIYFANEYPNATIYAIEPSKENYDILLKNTSKHKNIIPINAAIWSSNGLRELRSRFNGPWGCTISDTHNLTSPAIQKVECITIKLLMDKYDLEQIDVLKLDIEGSEKEVLEFSSDWIEKVNIITGELHDRITMGCSRSFYLATQNFKMFEINGTNVTAYRNFLP